MEAAAGCQRQASSGRDCWLTRARAEAGCKARALGVIRHEAPSSDSARGPRALDLARWVALYVRNRPKLDVHGSLARHAGLVGVSRREVASTGAAAGPRRGALAAAALEAAHL
jgi:hypothetical protein